MSSGALDFSGFFGVNPDPNFHDASSYQMNSKSTITITQILNDDLLNNTNICPSLDTYTVTAIEPNIFYNINSGGKLYNLN